MRSLHALASRTITRAAILLLPTLLVPGKLHAQPVSGLYIGAGLGWNHLGDETITDVSLAGASTSKYDGPAGFGNGVAAVTSVGWGFGNGLRTEIEFNYRNNPLQNVSGPYTVGGHEYKYGAMVNALYDFNFGWPVVPYVGAGIGWQVVGIDNGAIIGPGYYIQLQHPQAAFAVQAIAGVAWELPVHGLSLTAEYRFLDAIGSRQIYGEYFEANIVPPANTTFRGDANQAILLGLRYSFGPFSATPGK